MSNIDDLLRKRREMLDQIDKEIRNVYTKPVTLLFTDIVGSTRYFETMGDIAGRQMIQTHNDLLFPIITAHGGKIIKTIGDSIMASFDDPGEGVACAIGMQQCLKNYNTGKSSEELILVRMGLHFGEAVVEDKDLFGDMVNMSARVEARADAYEILVSAALKEKIGECPFPVLFLGSDFVKGKKEKIDFYIVNWNNLDEEALLDSWKKRTKTDTVPENIQFEKTAAIINRKVVIRGNIDLKKLAAAMKPLGKKGNPYLNRVMIPHPDMFFGRKAIVKRIMGRIQSGTPQSVSIVGERRIGKSSILKYMNFPNTRLAFMDEPEKYLFVFIDFQQMRGINESGLYSVIFSEFEKQLENNIEIACSPNNDGIRFLCDRIGADGYKLILFMDEFESVTKNLNIGSGFYSFFRSLANNYPIAFVAVSGRNLKDMCVTHEISDSPFFNIFALHHLGLFSRDDAKELIAIPSKELGTPLESIAGSIIRMAGLYPFFLQMACSAWFEYLDSESKSAEDFAQDASQAGSEFDYTPYDVIKMFREESSPHFEYICETLEKEEIELLKTCAKGGSIDPESRPAEILEQKGYLMRFDDKLLHPFCGEFEIFLKKRFA